MILTKDGYVLTAQEYHDLTYKAVAYNALRDEAIEKLMVFSEKMGKPITREQAEADVSRRLTTLLAVKAALKGQLDGHQETPTA